MKLYLMRHGYAGDDLDAVTDHDPKDLARSLLPEGVAAAENLAHWMVDNDCVPSVIHCSPVKRAEQTARIIAKIVFGTDRGFVVVNPNLAPHKPIGQVIVGRARDKAVNRPLLITHSDDITKELATLNGFDHHEAAPGSGIDPFAMCEIRCLSVDRDTFEWSEKWRVMPSDIIDKYDDAAEDENGISDFY